MISKGNEGDKAPQSGQQAAQPQNATMQQAFERAAPPVTPGRRTAEPSLANLNTLMRRPMARRGTGETVQAYVNALQERMKASFDPQFLEMFHIHVMDNNSISSIPLSVILVTYHLASGGSNHLGVYSLVVEASAGKLANRIYPYNGSQIEIETAAGDVVDETLWTKIKGFLQETYGRNQTSLIHNAGAMVLPQELSPQDAEHIHRVLFAATSALSTVMEKDVIQQETPLSISMIDTGTNLTATLDYNPPALDDATGLPKRSGVRVLLKGQMSNQSNTQAIHVPEVELTSVDAYIEPVFQEPERAAYNQQQDLRYYTPRIVITNIDSGVNAVTPETQLLGLTTATLLARSMAWGGVYANRYKARDSWNLTDIGAIGYEVNLSGDPNAPRDRIDTTADSFTNQELHKLLSLTFRDAPIFSMHVEETGEQSWLNQVFFNAAHGDAVANDDIIRAAVNLTDGHFRNHWTPGTPIVVDENTRVVLGYYKDFTTGALRDIRDIDYLAMLNLLGEKDMKAVIDWSRTYLDQSLPMEVRLEQNTKILRALVPEFKLKGYARLLTITPEFILALYNSAQAAGLNIRPANMLQNFNAQLGRGTYNAAQYGVSGSSVSTGVFNFGGGQGGFGSFRGGVGAPLRSFGR